jgi:hypothetical protein
LGFNKEEKIMGAAAYRRGSNAIAARIEAEREQRHPREFEMMDILNMMPKYEDCGRITEPVLFTFSHGVWWVNVERKPDGFGWWYRSLAEAVKRWSVVVTGYDNGTWRAIPINQKPNA